MAFTLNVFFTGLNMFVADPPSGEQLQSMTVLMMNAGDGRRRFGGRTVGVHTPELVTRSRDFPMQGRRVEFEVRPAGTAPVGLEKKRRTGSGCCPVDATDASSWAWVPSMGQLLGVTGRAQARYCRGTGNAVGGPVAGQVFLTHGTLYTYRLVTWGPSSDLTTHRVARVGWETVDGSPITDVDAKVAAEMMLLKSNVTARNADAVQVIFKSLEDGTVVDRRTLPARPTRPGGPLEVNVLVRNQPQESDREQRGHHFPLFKDVLDGIVTLPGSLPVPVAIDPMSDRSACPDVQPDVFDEAHLDLWPKEKRVKYEGNRPICPGSEP